MDAPRPRRVLGIDFGERRIGLALSDPDGLWALPFRVLERQTDRRAIYQIADLARQEEVGLLVVGEPIGLDSSSGSGVERIRRFGAKLAGVTGLPIHWVNEALTTVEARERLRDAGAERPSDASSRSGRRDAVAAQILLQEALDQRARESSPEGTSPEVMPPEPDA